MLGHLFASTRSFISISLIHLISKKYKKKMAGNNNNDNQ